MAGGPLTHTVSGVLHRNNDKSSKIVICKRTDLVREQASKHAKTLFEKWVQNPDVDKGAMQEVVSELSAIGEFIGEWQFPDGSYHGQWTKGVATGLGVRISHEHKWSYAGTWHVGKFSGAGVYNTYTRENLSYAGQWVSGLKHGFGVQETTEYVFAGTWDKGARGRFGILTAKGTAGYVYEGTFVNEHAHGFGRETAANGGIYLGQFVNGKRKGHGTKLIQDSAGGHTIQYEGDWDDDCRDGHGIYTYPDGRTYVGEWSRNGRRGYGAVLDQNGNMSVCGKWENDSCIAKSAASSKVAVAMQKARLAQRSARENFKVSERTADKGGEKGNMAHEHGDKAKAMAKRAELENTLFESLAHIDDDAAMETNADNKSVASSASLLRARGRAGAQRKAKSLLSKGPPTSGLLTKGIAGTADDPVWAYSNTMQDKAGTVNQKRLRVLGVLVVAAAALWGFVALTGAQLPGSLTVPFE